MDWPWAAAAAAIALLAFISLQRARRRRDEARAFARGVRSVLSDDSDAAIAALSDAARLGTEAAIDTYLAAVDVGGALDLLLHEGREERGLREELHHPGGRRDGAAAR